MTRRLSSVLLAAVIGSHGVLAGAQAITVKVPPDLGKQMGQRVRALTAEGKLDEALREARAWMELYPNEPRVRATLFAAMANVATRAGDTARAAEFTAIAQALDPSAVAPRTRGRDTDPFAIVDAALAAAAARGADAMPAAGTDPYRLPEGFTAPRLRGAAPLRVLHDHSLLADEAFFGVKACAAEITGTASGLIFVPPPGEAALNIPASDVFEVALNRTVGVEIGAFHVITRRGLYLHLAPAAGGTGAGQQMVTALRKALKLP